MIKKVSANQYISNNYQQIYYYKIKYLIKNNRYIAHTQKKKKVIKISLSLFDLCTFIYQQLSYLPTFLIKLFGNS